MEVIYGLIPGMIFLGLVMVGIMVWAVKQGQYEDLEGEASRILMDEDDPLLPANQPSQNVREAATVRTVDSK
ncbi:MAG: cbb3-type cytochrome oxidase assembly protein CcoS [Gammaproteobacteria bacterium]|nr:cbb3-type cytochrome oxidase assembly protein CcoS [Gammaproteobacteria bacterium]